MVGLDAFFGDFVTDFFATFLAPAFFATVAFLTTFLTAGTFFAAGNLNDPDAPLPFVCNKSPLATALFKNFLMNGASFSQSTL